MATLAITSTADQVAADVTATGGSTRSVVPGVRPPRQGYMVSLQGFEERPAFWSIDTVDKVAQYIDQYAAHLAQPGNYLGAWIDDGQLYLDVSVNVASLADAYRRGCANQQLAIWDVSGEREIRLDSVEPFPAVA